MFLIVPHGALKLSMNLCFMIVPHGALKLSMNLCFMIVIHGALMYVQLLHMYTSKDQKETT